MLEAVSAYKPANEQEVFDIMNVLDDRLLHSNSAVVMATVKLFLHLTLTMPPTHQQVHSHLRFLDDLISLQLTLIANMQSLLCCSLLCKQY